MKKMLVVLALMLKVYWSTRFAAGSGIVVGSVTVGNTVMFLCRVDSKRIEAVNFSDVTGSVWVDVQEGV